MISLQRLWKHWKHIKFPNAHGRSHAYFPHVIDSITKNKKCVTGTAEGPEPKVSESRIAGKLWLSCPALSG
jgi:hypothetical protein